MGQHDLALPLLQRSFRIVFRADTPAEVAAVASSFGEFYQKRVEPGPAIFYYKLSVNASQRLRAGGAGVGAGATALDDEER